MEVVVAAALEVRPAGEIGRRHVAVLSPEPGKVLFLALWLGAAIGPDETIILCPANHSPPTSVAPFPGAPGYEAAATCLASPEVRARTEGVIAWRPQVVA